jgi:hypothetical protein
MENALGNQHESWGRLGKPRCKGEKRSPPIIVDARENGNQINRTRQAAAVGGACARRRAQAEGAEVGLAQLQAVQGRGEGCLQLQLRLAAFRRPQHAGQSLLEQAEGVRVEPADLDYQDIEEEAGLVVDPSLLAAILRFASLLPEVDPGDVLQGQQVVEALFRVDPPEVQGPPGLAANASHAPP